MTMALKAEWRGRFFEAFSVGDACKLPLGRIITATALFLLF